MKTREISTLSAAVAILAFSVAFSTTATSADDGWFPYQKGNYWVYEGEVDYIGHSTEGIPVSRKLNWITRVEDSVETGSWSIALVKGMPGDAAWFSELATTGMYLVAMDAEGRIYEYPSEAAAIIFWKLRAGKPEKLPEFLTAPENQTLRRGMLADEVFGSAEDVAPDDVRPGWHSHLVEEVKDDASDIDGLSDEVKAAVKNKVYRLSWRSSSDHTIRNFAPGVGYVGYEYGHHGTPGDCFLKLVKTGTDPEGNVVAGPAKLGPPVDDTNKPVLTYSIVSTFLAASSSDGSLEELGNLLADEVNWFGSRKKREDILAEEKDYYANWPLRKMRLVGGDLAGNMDVVKTPEGFSLRYTFTVNSANLAEKKRSAKTLRADMTVIDGGDGNWRISAIKSLGAAPGADVVMGERVGPVKREMKLEDLVKEVGAKNITTRNVRNELEDIDETISTLFAGTNKEMEVFWEHEQPARVVVNMKNSAWRTPADIGVGTGLFELENANGGPFKLFGFGWDYGGTIASFDGGKLAQQHAVGHLFSAWLMYPDGADSAAVEKVLGDQVFQSDNEAMRKLFPSVGGIEFHFPYSTFHIGGLAEGQGQHRVEEMIPADPVKGEEELWGADGLHHQEWSYPDYGLSVDMASEDKGGYKDIASITAKAPCRLVTDRGVGIGSTLEELALAYADKYSAGDSEPGRTFVAGSVFGGLIFQLKDGRVTEMFLGAAAE